MPAYIVTGLGYGDEGKGLVTDYLARQHQASGVVRFNGGAQAAHNVVLPNGLHHTFSQFGSGTFSGTPTYLSEHMLVNPHALFVEWEKIADTWAWPSGLVNVHEDALITTPFHVAANRIREIGRGASAHGTCGMGIGETVMQANQGYKLTAKDLKDPKKTYAILHDIQSRLRRDVMSIITEMVPGAGANHMACKLFDFQAIKEALEIYRLFVKHVPQYTELPMQEDETWVFEGAQGVLLDQYHGFHPHTTWSKTTPENAKKLLEGSGMDTTVIGVMRSYMTRHGHGPFPTGDQSLWPRFPEAHNSSKSLQGTWRVGWTDLRAMRYAIDCCGGIDELAVTHLDRVEGDWKIGMDYDFELGVPAFDSREKWEVNRKWVLEKLATHAPSKYAEFSGMAPGRLLAEIEDELGVDVNIGSHGPCYKDVSELARV